MKAKKRTAPSSLGRFRPADSAIERASQLYTLAQSDVSRRLTSLLNSGDSASIVSASDQLDPSSYTSAGSFSLDYLCVELMSKFPNWELGIDRAGVALEKFMSSEVRLNEVDPSFPNLSLLVPKGRRVTLSAVLFTARTIISRLLGDFDFDELVSSCTFGPGASTSLPRNKSDKAFKFGAATLQATRSATAYIPVFRSAFPSWGFEVDEVLGSRFTTVPKNAKTDRGICIEPDLNMFVQKGLGNMIRKRLQRIGLLTPTAFLDNQEAARAGSVDGSISTIDLSGASDSLHLELVRQLVRSDWFVHLEQVRSPYVRLTSEVVRLTKISSMGNGNTFELETLIFYALARAVADLLGDGNAIVRVFGDDIAVPTHVAEPLIEILRAVGFTTNERKTFLTGPFRESCGKHFFLGDDVTPFYIRSPVDSLARLFWLHNSIKRWSRLAHGYCSRFKPICDDIIESIPVSLRFKTPDSLGDSGLLHDFDEVAPHPVRRRRLGGHHEGWKVKCLLTRSSPVVDDSQGVLLKSLHNLERGAPLEGSQRPDLLTSAAVVRNRSMFRVGWAKAIQWPSQGPWY